MTREEILNLDKLSEGEQVEWLLKNHIIKNRVVKYSWGTTDVYESLADCAFRLRDEVFRKVPNVFMKMRIIFNTVNKNPLIDDWNFWFAYNAAPIHFIQAALLAKGEGKE
jgi:hypothetical protein